MKHNSNFSKYTQKLRENTGMLRVVWKFDLSFSYIFESLFCPLHFVCVCMCTCVYFVFEKIETEKWKPNSQFGTWIVYG